MIYLHKHTNGTYFLFADGGYYTLKKASSTSEQEDSCLKYEISGHNFYR